MPKRNTTQDAIENLNAADREAVSARAELMASIPAPVFRSDIPFSRVIRSRALNIRDESSYGFKANRALFNSLKEFGLQVRNPFMSFSLRANGDFMVESGNLRTEAIELIRSEESARREKEGIETTPENPLPFEFIHGLVFTGLTLDQERALVADQQIAKGLNEFEMAKAIGEFAEVNPGLTDAKAAIYWGMEKNKVRRLRMRYAMPTVLEEYRKEKSKDADVSFIKVGNEQLDPLYTEMLKDRDSGCKFREEGAFFKRAWKQILENPDALKRSGKPKSDDKSKSAEVINQQISGVVPTFGETPEVTAIILALTWAIGENGPNGEPIKLQNVISEVKAYADGLRADSANLATVSKDRDSYRDSWESENTLRTQAETERDTLRAELKAIKSAPVAIEHNGGKKAK